MLTESGVKLIEPPVRPEAMAELIVDGTVRTVDLTPFDPARLPAKH